MTRSAPGTHALEPASDRAPRHSVQRLVRPRHRHNSNLHFLQPPDCNRADQMNNDEKYAVPIAEQIPARSKGKIPAVLGDEIYSVNQSPAGGKRKASAVKPAVHQKRQEVHDTDNKPAKSKPLSTCARGKS